MTKSRLDYMLWLTVIGLIFFTLINTLMLVWAQDALFWGRMCVSSLLVIVGLCLFMVFTND